MAVGAGSVLAVAPAAPAAAYPSGTVTLTANGFGHGRGMGQYGALGYAFDGWTYQHILHHYYGTLADGGTTTLGQIPTSNPESSQVRVSLTWLAGSPGNELWPIVTAAVPYTIGGHQIPAGTAAELVPVSGTQGDVFDGDVYLSGSCGGGTTGWPATPTYQNVALSAAPVTPAPFPQVATPQQVLELCPTANHGASYLRGSVYVTQSSNGDNRTVNTVPLEQYVADSAAAESPGDWGTLNGPDSPPNPPQGLPWGFQSTEAQVVATRSYAASSPGGYGGYADICDSTACQSYPGIAFENATDNLAAEDTAGQVVLLPDGSVARTEYSASTGGYTAPGTFAAVPDAGDAVCTPQVCNPYHQYQVAIPVAAIEATFPSTGTLQSVTVKARNGYGEYGGRVDSVAIIGSSATITVSGSQFAADFAAYGPSGYVMSDWFVVQGQSSGGVGGYWLLGSHGNVYPYGNALSYGSMGGKPLNQPVVGMAATPDGRGYWLVASDGGIFNFGDARFYGSLVSADPGEVAAAAMATADGGGYLIVTTDGHVVPFGDAPQFGDIATTTPGWSGKLIGAAVSPG